MYLKDSWEIRKSPKWKHLELYHKKTGEFMTFESSDSEKTKQIYDHREKLWKEYPEGNHPASDHRDEHALDENSVFERLLMIYDNINDGQSIPQGLSGLIMDYADKLDRWPELRVRDAGYEYPTFVRNKS